MSVLEELVRELRENPELALQLSEAMGSIAGPWEEQGGEYTVRNMQGQEIAHISKAYPKWRVVVNGEVSKQAPFIMHAKDAVTAKVFVEEKLREQGFIIRSSAEDED
jgi:hypothetical protein